MRKLSIFLTAILMLSSVVAAQENSTANNGTPENIQGQKTVVVLDTHNKTGYLTYKEEYYTVNKSGFLVFEKGRVFFRGNINVTVFQLRIIRPLASNGEYYNESGVKAIATLDNKTILDQFYARRPGANITNKTDETSTKKSPGFGGFISLVTLVCLAITGKNRYKTGGK